MIEFSVKAKILVSFFHESSMFVNIINRRIAIDMNDVAVRK